jgi:hypothetical protein
MMMRMVMLIMVVVVVMMVMRMVMRDGLGGDEDIRSDVRIVV